MRGRNRFIFGILFAVSTAICTPSIAQNTDIVGITRGASLFFEFYRQCSDIFEIDENAAKAQFETFIRMGFRQFGLKEFNTAMEQEYKRRAQEVEITGRNHWCTYQRAYIEKMGGKTIFRR